MSPFTPLPAGPYGAIVADPPWAFKRWSGPPTVAHRKAGPPYAVLEEAALCRLPVGNVAAKDGALFMWVVDAHLPEALRVGAAWGFEFKTIAFVWTKGAIGMGYWTRKQAEVCLLFTRGKPKRREGGVPQVIAAARRAHSQKPEEARVRVERLVAGPYLELFARPPLRAGWDSWGLGVPESGLALVGR